MTLELTDVPTSPLRRESGRPRRQFELMVLTPIVGTILSGAAYLVFSSRRPRR